MGLTMERAETRRKTRVVILGGGAGGVSTAFWLTSTPELRERFEVTLYSRGWRLGGKAASGRNLGHGGRIEEHGLHMLMGCYQNAFRTIRACYEAWQPPVDNRIRTWQEAFAPERDVYMWDGGASRYWHVPFPTLPGVPGDSVATPIRKLLQALIDRITPHFRSASWRPGTEYTAEIRTRLDELRKIHDQPLDEEVHRRATMHLDALHRLHAAAQGWREDVRGETRHLWILLDIGLAMAKGIWRDVLVHVLRGGMQHALDKLDEKDFRRWLGEHGADEASLAAPPLEVLYDLAFAYRKGDASDPSQASMAAGVTLRFALEFVLDYRDAPLWRMRAGMGDVIFTPFYQVLDQRGANIRLFHAVREIVPAPDGRSVARIRIDRQADPVDGRYDPFVRVKGLDCWPNEPLWDKLVGGDRLKNAPIDFESVWDTTAAGAMELEAGRDFDLAVLAFPPEMQKIVAPGLAIPGSAYARMLEHSASVATHSMQLWLTKGTDEIAPYGPEPLMGTLPEPYDSWADMSELLGAEDWPAAESVASIQYLCGVTEPPPPGGGNPIGEGHALAEASSEEWIARHAGAVWPLGSWPEPAGEPSELIAAHYFRGNVEPSELYVLTPAGTVASRLAAGSSGYANLVLAGDWTRTRFSGGCFEAAIESGMLASRKISGVPAAIVGEEHG